ncbi:glycine zipper family protein [Vibrio gallicus]|uniref:glycine zipper family protein n=1 Tax=Vibrio gallicus TaxID=190897 RepID=UPI0021C3E89A|nr:glycine zipper family protein [Vibrio gallicus]
MRVLYKALTLSCVSLFISLPAQAHGLIYDSGQYEANVFQQDMHYCEGLAQQTPQQEADGLVQETAKRGMRGATAGAVAGSVSGNSGSSAAKTGAAVGMTLGVLGNRGNRKATEQNNQRAYSEVVRNCMSGRGYTALN